MGSLWHAEYAEEPQPVGAIHGSLYWHTIASDRHAERYDGPFIRPTIDPRPPELIQAYALLELPDNPMEQDVDRAYRRLAHRYHPDAGGSDAEMAALNNAYARAKEWCAWRASAS